MDLLTIGFLLRLIYGKLVQVLGAWLSGRASN